MTMLDQSVYTATVVGGDEGKDIAVLELDCPRDVARNFKPVILGSSAPLLVGQQVYAIGNPFGLDHTLTQGIISGLGRELNTGAVTIKGAIQTDAAINPGNSGSPQWGRRVQDVEWVLLLACCCSGNIRVLDYLPGSPVCEIEDHPVTIVFKIAVRF